MRVVVNVFLKEGVLDPQGKATENALKNLGFNGVGEVRVGKQIVLDLMETDKAKAIESATKMAKELLVNEAVEEFVVEAK